MRSESDGHCYPTSFPGLAPREAVRRGNLTPLAQTRLQPLPADRARVPRHVDELRERSRWDESVVSPAGRTVSARSTAASSSTARRFRHVLLAPGHPGLALPDELEGDARVVHAYEPHEYASRVAIVGAGMAAATEWLNALAAGAEVVSVRRREPLRRAAQPSPPARSPSAASRRFHATPPAERAELLAELSAPSYPPGRAWDEPLERAAAEGASASPAP